MAHKNNSLVKTYEIINHTADFGIRVYGKSLKALFLNAAEAMFTLMLEATKKRPPFKRKNIKNFIVNKQGNDLEEIFVAWLSELLYLFSAESLVMNKVEIEKLDANLIQAQVSGDIFDKEYYRINTEIKAVTYHELEVKKVDSGYEAQVIFDV